MDGLECFVCESGILLVILREVSVGMREKLVNIKTRKIHACIDDMKWRSCSELGTFFIEVRFYFSFSYTQ